jgi:hypothetical protein
MDIFPHILGITKRASISVGGVIATLESLAGAIAPSSTSNLEEHLSGSSV